MKGLIIRILKQMLNDKRTLALIFIMPLFIVTLIYFLLGTTTDNMTVTLKGANETIISYFEEECTVVDVSKDLSAREIMENENVDAIVDFSNHTTIYLYEPDSAKLATINGVLKEIQSDTGQTPPEISYLYGENLDTLFDQLIYALLGILAFFFVFLISGITFVHERTLGTLERMMLTPVKRPTVIGGITLGFGIIGILQSVLMFIFTISVFAIEVNGSYLGALLIMVMISLTAISMGLFVSIFAHSEFQVAQFIPVIIVPQIFLSGIFPLDGLPLHLDSLKYITPIYYGCNGLKKILIYGENFTAVWPELIVLGGLIVFFFLLNIVFLKRYRAE
jgi:ABC-2 type transport system permease protein